MLTLALQMPDDVKSEFFSGFRYLVGKLDVKSNKNDEMLTFDVP